MANELAVSAFSGTDAFEIAQRMGKMLQESDLVPQQFKGSLPNCVIALEMSQRLGMNPLAIMQNIYIVHGKPAWSSQFLIACVNGCGKFSPLRYDLTGEAGQDSRTCVAWAYDLANDERLEGPPVSIAIAKKEGWHGKSGSKWQTMPELMLRYRAATFFARTYCPELTMGMQTQEEIKDVHAVVVDSADLAPRKKHQPGDTTAATTTTLSNAQVATEAVKRGRGRPKKTEAAPPAEETQPEQPEAHTAEVEESPVCAEYAELEKFYERMPGIVKRACEEVAKGYGNGMAFEKFAEIDGADSMICGEILEVAQRIRDNAQG